MKLRIFNGLEPLDKSLKISRKSPGDVLLRWWRPVRPWGLNMTASGGIAFINTSRRFGGAVPALAGKSWRKTTNVLTAKCQVLTGKQTSESKTETNLGTSSASLIMLGLCPGYSLLPLAVSFMC
jgi:hypothetical protein